MLITFYSRYRGKKKVIPLINSQLNLGLVLFISPAFQIKTKIVNLIAQNLTIAQLSCAILQTKRATIFAWPIQERRMKERSDAYFFVLQKEWLLGTCKILVPYVSRTSSYEYIYNWYELVTKSFTRQCPTTSTNVLPLAIGMRLPADTTAVFSNQ